MSDVSLHGRVAPKSKSINVEANLLTERLAFRARFREQIRKRMIIQAAAVLSVALILPPIFRAHRDVTAKFSALSAQQKHIEERLADLQKQQDTVKPVIQDQQTMDSIRRHAHEFLGQLTLFMNNVDPQLGINTFRMQIDNRVIEISAQAQAISYDVASRFVSKTGKAPNAAQTVVSSMNSDATMGPQGVNFDLDQKIQVSP